MRFKKYTKYFAAAAVLLIAAMMCFEADAADESMDVTFFSVGKADSILIKQGDKAMLIDTALSEDAPYILRRLSEKGVASLDALLITHMDEDHVGGAAQILADIPTAAVYQPKEKSGSVYAKAYRQAMDARGMVPVVLSRDLEVQIGDMEITMYPPKKTKGMVPNDYSVIASVGFGGTRALFTGDATAQRLRNFLKKPQTHIDLLKVPHHGMINTKKGQYSRLLRADTPQYAVITDNVRDELRKKVIMLSELMGVRETFMTDNGDVEAVSDGRKFTVRSAGWDAQPPEQTQPVSGDSTELSAEK